MPRLRACSYVLACGYGVLASVGCAQLLGIDHDYGDRPPDVDGALSGPSDAASAQDAMFAVLSSADAGFQRDARHEQDATHDDAVPMSSDAGASADARTDDAGAAGADASFCANYGAHLVCDDFDQPPPQAWLETTVAGSQQVDALSASSAPNAYAASTNAIGAGAMAKVARYRTFSSAPSAYHFEYSLRIDARDTSSAPALASVEVKNPQTGAYYSGGLVVLATGVVYEDVLQTSSASPESHVRRPLSRNIANGSWVRVVSDVAFAPSGATLTLRLDDALVLDHAPLQATTVAGQTSLFIGITFLGGPAAAWRVRYDDVVFDLR